MAKNEPPPPPRFNILKQTPGSKLRNQQSAIVKNKTFPVLCYYRNLPQAPNPQSNYSDFSLLPRIAGFFVQRLPLAQHFRTRRTAEGCPRKGGGRSLDFQFQLGAIHFRNVLQECTSSYAGRYIEQGALGCVGQEFRDLSFNFPRPTIHPLLLDTKYT